MIELFERRAKPHHEIRKAPGSEKIILFPGVPEDSELEPEIYWAKRNFVGRLRAGIGEAIDKSRKRAVFLGEPLKHFSLF